MIVADDHALARVLGANDVAGNGGRDEAGVREGEIFSDDGAPAVGAKLNLRRAAARDRLQMRGHTPRKYTRRFKCQKSRIGVLTAGPCGRAPRAI